MKLVPRIIESAKKDPEFLELAKCQIKDFQIPNAFTSQINDTLFATLYMGYLLGKYQDDPAKYIKVEEINHISSASSAPLR